MQVSSIFTVSIMLKSVRCEIRNWKLPECVFVAGLFPIQNGLAVRMVKIYLLLEPFGMHVCLKTFLVSLLIVYEMDVKEMNEFF